MFHDRQGTFNPFNTDVTAAGVGRMLNAMGVAGVTVTDVADVGEEGATGVDIDWGNGRKTRVVMTPGTVDEKNVRADGVWIHRKDGTPVDASAAITDLIRVATSTDTGSIALVGHELAHNLLSIARDTEALSKEQWEAIQKAYTLENGRFDEERLADDFGFYVTDMLRKNAKDYRVRRPPNTAAGKALHAVAAFFGAIARAVLRRRNAEAVRNFDVGSVLETFLREGEAIRYSSTVEAERARDARNKAREPFAAKDDDGTEVAYHERVSAEEDKAYLDAVKNGDLDTARRMVMEAARLAGYDVEAFHGAGRFGFTVFNPRRTRNGDLRPEDERTIFLGNLAIASSYSGEVEPREIGKPVPKISLAKMMKSDASLLKEMQRVAKLVGADVKIKKWYERDFRDAECKCFCAGFEAEN